MMRPLAPLLLGFSIWALAFVLLYAAQALGCVWEWPEAAHRGALITIWIAALTGMTLLLWNQWHRRSAQKPLLSTMGVSATVAAIGATVLTFFPVTFSSLCI